MPAVTKPKLSNFRTQRLNANKHTPRGLGLLADSIEQDGWIGAMTVAADGETFDGSARLEVLADAMPSAEPIVVDSDGTRPVIVRRTDIPTTDDPRAKRLGLGANRIAQVDLDWDADALAALAGDVDLSKLWNKDELAELLKGMGGNEAEDPGAQIDKAAELQAKWQTSLGQVWELGKHRIICGDCTDASVVDRLMRGEKARLCHTDPPYGVDYANVLGGRENQKQGGWSDIQGDALGDADLLNLLTGALALTDAPVLFVWHSWKRIRVFLDAIERAGWKPNSEIVWVKNALVFGRSDYQWRHECCIYAKRDGAGRQDNRKETTVWEFPKTTGALHPTQKPVELFEIPMQNHTNPDDICYEPFSGSGAQILAGERLGRRVMACEIEPKYVAVTLERWSTATGQMPVCVSGQ